MKLKTSAKRQLDKALTVIMSSSYDEGYNKGVADVMKALAPLLEAIDLHLSTSIDNLSDIEPLEAALQDFNEKMNGK